MRHYWRNKNQCTRCKLKREKIVGFERQEDGSKVPRTFYRYYLKGQHVPYQSCFVYEQLLLFPDSETKIQTL